MVVLGIAGRRADAAAALTVDGCLVAAATEESFHRVPGIGYRQTGGFPFRAAAACLEQAGLSSEDVTVIAVADRCPRIAGGTLGTQRRSDPGSFRMPLARDGNVDQAVHMRPGRAIDRLHAHAAQVAAATDSASALAFILDGERGYGGGVFVKQDGRVHHVAPIRGVDDLWCSAGRLARALGRDGADPVQGLEGLGAFGEPEFISSFERILSWSPEAGVRVDNEALSELLAVAEAHHPGRLSDPASVNIHVQSRQRNLAASFHARVSELVCGMACSFAERANLDVVGLGGSFFSSPHFNSSIRRALGSGVYVAPVPETPGRAIGAALSGGSAPAGPIATLALGPDFTESQIKVVLENCRLDYLYEPDWKRLLTRISGMLSQGKVIAWFQGAMEFGPRSLGSRSILCDPSSRYARANINGYLKHRPEDFPMAVSMTEAAADTCLVTPLRSPYMSFQAVVRPDWRDSLRAALDHRQSCPVHTVTAEQSPYLWALLDLHWKEAKVPGLINTTLNAPGEPVACTARDAIRTTFSSAIDALVLGRFLLMKDYWLLRSDADLCPGRR